MVLNVFLKYRKLRCPGWLLWRNANMHWAKSQVAKIEELAKAGKYLKAYDLSIVIQKYLGQDETINRLLVGSALFFCAEQVSDTQTKSDITQSKQDKDRPKIIGSPVNPMNLPMTRER
jgi:hypothetical protein